MSRCCTGCLLPGWSVGAEPGSQEQDSWGGHQGNARLSHWAPLWGQDWTEVWLGCGSAGGSGSVEPMAGQSYWRAGDWICWCVGGKGFAGLRGLTWCPGLWVGCGQSQCGSHQWSWEVVQVQTGLWGHNRRGAMLLILFLLLQVKWHL